MFNIDATLTSLVARCGGLGFQADTGHGFQAVGRGFQASASRGGRGHFQRGHGMFQQPEARAPNDGMLGVTYPQGNVFNPNGCVQCQICRKPGHSAINCYNRMNVAYKCRVPAPKLQSYAAAVPIHDSSPMAAPPVQNWLFDSGANAHITNNLA